MTGAGLVPSGEWKLGTAKPQPAPLGGRAVARAGLAPSRVDYGANLSGHWTDTLSGSRMAGEGGIGGRCPA